MKNIFKGLSILSVSFIVFSSFICIHDVPLKGEWEDKGLRSLMPDKPRVTINDNLLVIHFSDNLRDVLINVEDKDGNIIYNSRVSTPHSDYNIEIFLDNLPREYKIIISSHYGTLIGEFQSTKSQ